METKIINKRSNSTSQGAAKVPLASELDYGEIAVNYHDGVEKIFIKNDNNEIVSFPTDGQIDAKISNVIGDIQSILQTI